MYLLWFVKNGCHASCMHLYLHCTPLSPGGTEICILQAHMHALHWDLKHSLHIHCSLSPELDCTRKEHYLRIISPTTNQPKAQSLNRTTSPAPANSDSALKSRHCPNTCTVIKASTWADQWLTGMPRFQNCPQGGQPKNLPLFPGHRKCKHSQQ